MNSHIVYIKTIYITLDVNEVNLLETPYCMLLTIFEFIYSYNILLHDMFSKHFFNQEFELKPAKGWLTLITPLKEIIITIVMHMAIFGIIIIYKNNNYWNNNIESNWYCFEQYFNGNFIYQIHYLFCTCPSIGSILLFTLNIICIHAILSIKKFNKYGKQSLKFQIFILKKAYPGIKIFSLYTF